MKTLRSTAWLRRWMAALLLLSMGVAMATPLVQPRAMEIVCAGAGATKLLVQAANNVHPGHDGFGMECLLCLLEGAPPFDFSVHVPAAPPLALGAALHTDAPLWVSAAALPPARAPPVSLVP